MFPIPRQGYIFTVPVESPWGEMVGELDISPMVNTAPGSWHQVVQGWDGSPYLDGSFVYSARTAGEPVVMAERTIGLMHESQIKATLPRDSFKPRYESASTEVYMAAFREAIESRSRPKIVTPRNAIEG